MKAGVACSNTRFLPVRLAGPRPVSDDTRPFTRTGSFLPQVRAADLNDLVQALKKQGRPEPSGRDSAVEAGPDRKTEVKYASGGSPLSPLKASLLKGGRGVCLRPVLAVETEVEVFNDSLAVLSSPSLLPLHASAVL